MTSQEPAPPTAEPPTVPFAPQELRAAWRNPQRLPDLLFVERQRLAGTLIAGQGLPPLAALLLVGSVLAVLPFGFALLGPSGWRLPALFTGSVLLCWPSLQVFSVWLGCRCRPLQSLTLAMLTAAVAGLFTLGFAPIVWFLDQTMRQGDVIDARALGIALLAVSLVAGLGELLRCLLRTPLPGAGDLTRMVWLLWAMLLVAIHVRMARVLGLLP